MSIKFSAVGAYFPRISSFSDQMLQTFSFRTPSFFVDRTKMTLDNADNKSETPEISLAGDIGSLVILYSGGTSSGSAPGRV